MKWWSLSLAVAVFAALGTLAFSYDFPGDFDKALADFNRVLELRPDYGKEYFNRGEVYYAKEDWGKAVADYSQALRYGYADAVVYTHRGGAYFKQANTPRAIADFNQGIARNNRDYEAYTLRGDAQVLIRPWVGSASPVGVPYDECKTEWFCAARRTDCSANFARVTYSRAPAGTFSRRPVLRLSSAATSLASGPPRAGTDWCASQRGSTRSVWDSQMMTARSITFCSSRTFPGHGQRDSTSRLSRETDSIDRRRRFANRCAK
jgi:tetratricopeptide (TPR) repeat protein